MPTEIETKYRKWRKLRPELPASDALAWARCEIAQAAILARFGEWTFTGLHGYDTFAYADLDDAPDGFIVRVLVGDDDTPIEWGDYEPSELERENACGFYVAVVVLSTDDEGTELFHNRHRRGRRDRPSGLLAT